MEIEETEQMAYHKLSMVEPGLELRTFGPLQVMAKSYSPTRLCSVMEVPCPQDISRHLLSIYYVADTYLVVQVKISSSFQLPLFERATVSSTVYREGGFSLWFLSSRDQPTVCF